MNIPLLRFVSLALALVVSAPILSAQAFDAAAFEKEAAEQTAWESRMRHTASGSELKNMIETLRQGGSPLPPAELDRAANALALARGAYRETSEKLLETLTDMYLTSVYLSIIYPEKHAGWPFRSQVLIDDPIPILTRLKARLEKNPDATLKYALICPALYDGQTKLANEMEAQLKQQDPFLYGLVQKYRKKIWEPFIAKAKN